ncbi:MAG: hypothetical protein JOZ23_01710, partial [Mycobacterium sp.]|nr:hypothetical protein [Mycobacterium sp.]
MLDLVGNSTILDSLDMLRCGGTACLAGWLGGLAPIADFHPLQQLASGVNLTFFGRWPTADSTQSRRILSLDEIREAQRIMEAGEADGKMVVVVESPVCAKVIRDKRIGTRTVTSRAERQLKGSGMSAPQQD